MTFLSTPTKGLLVNVTSYGFDGLGTIHELIAQTAINIKYSRRPGENLPYSPSLLEDYLRAAFPRLDPTQETQQRWASHGLRLLAVNGVQHLVRQILNDYPDVIQDLQQKTSFTGWLTWAKMYEALGLLDESTRCFNAVISTEPQTPHEKCHWLSLINRLGTNQQKQEAIAQTTTWLQHHSEDYDVRAAYLAMIGQFGTFQQKQEAIAQTATWLQHHSEDYHVHRQYLALIRQCGTSQQRQEAIAQTTTWLQHHSEDYDVRVAYLALIERYGTSQQKQEAIAQTTTWLQHHSEDTSVRTKYLALIGQHGTSQQKQAAIAQTTTWLQHHSEDNEVRTKYLALIGQWGTSQQKQEAIAQTTTWLQQHSEDTVVRRQYLALIGQCGTSQQKQEAIAQTTTWLQQYESNYGANFPKRRRRKKSKLPPQTAPQKNPHPRTGGVRTIYLVLVGKAGKDIIDVEPIIMQQWQWFSQQPRVEQSLWDAFLPLLYYHAQIKPNFVSLIPSAVNLALKQYPKNQSIISSVFGYFRDYLDQETCYRLAEVISEYRFIKEISFWRHFIYAANFFRDEGDLNKAEAIYRRVLNTAESWLNQHKGDSKSLQKTYLFASLNYAYLLLLHQPADPYRAIDYLEPVLEDNPKHSMAYYYMALCYQAKGEKFYPQAIQHFKKALKFDREKVGYFWYPFGCFYRDAMENQAEACQCFQNSLKQKINLPACIDLADLELEAGNWETAEDLLEQGLALVPLTRPEKEYREKLQPRIEAIQESIHSHRHHL